MCEKHDLPWVRQKNIRFYRRNLPEINPMMNKSGIIGILSNTEVVGFSVRMNEK